MEVLANLERVVCRSDVATMKPGQLFPSGLHVRRLPLSVLGQGRCGLADNVQARLHQTWLDHGPIVGQVRAANADVRQVLTDMGTELGVVDFPYVLDLCFQTRENTRL